MSSAEQREWRLYVNDMAEFAARVQDYTAGLDQASFLADRKTFDATVRNLELIGEVASRVPESVRASNPQVPWRMIVATRNRLIHGYLGIDSDTLWNIITEDIPALIETLRMRSANPS
jgi:uncharacterized protein with HEPN domain